MPVNASNNSSEHKTLTVAGVDRRADLGQEIAAQAAALPGKWVGERLRGESPILDLGEATSEQEFLDRHLKIFGTRTHLGFDDFSFPPGRSFVGRVVGLFRRLGWRIMRPPHEWVAFQQTAVNIQLYQALELEVRLRKRENAELRERLHALEAAAGGSLPEAGS